MKKSGKCPKCDCIEIVDRVEVLIPARGSVHLAIDGDPDALILKDTKMSEIAAFVCAACGFTEFYAAKPADLELGQRAAAGRSAKHPDALK